MHPDPWNNSLLEYSDYFTKFDLAPFDRFDENYVGAPDVFQSGAVIATTSNFDSRLRSQLSADPASITVISGFDSAGDLHLGNLVILRQMLYYKLLGCTVRIPLVDLEAVAVRGDSVIDAYHRAKRAIMPLLEHLGFDSSEIYIRSEVESIIRLMAQISRVADSELLDRIYGRRLSGGEFFSLIFMAADLLRPQIEDSQTTVAVYGIDEAPHIAAINNIASKLELLPISATFSVLIPSRKHPKLKMSKSAAKHELNIPLSISPGLARRHILDYDVLVPCMIERIRRYLLSGEFAIRPEEICTMRCEECKQQTSEFLEALFRTTLPGIEE